LATLRAKHPPAENFWWHLDVEVATRRRKAITRFVVTTLLVVVGVVGGLWSIDKIFPPDPRAVALLNANAGLDPYIAEQRWDDALQVIEEAKGSLPDEPELYIWEGVLAEQAGYQERAQTALARARDLLPGQTEQFWVLVGNRRMQVGNLDGAIAAANETLALDPDDPQAHFLIGGIAEARGDTQTAIAEFNLVFDLAEESNPQLAVIARVRMGTLLQQVNPFPETPITPTLAVSVTGTISATLTPSTP
jgi:tetratricopeptide (TPR) repeat protein